MKKKINKKNFFFASSPSKLVKVSWVTRMGRNFDDYPGFQLFFTQGKHFCPDCIYNNNCFFLGYENIDAKPQSHCDCDSDCVFPFTYGEKNLRKKYYHCTPVGHNRPWCATEVDANGNYIKGKYRNCEIRV